MTKKTQKPQKPTAQQTSKRLTNFERATPFDFAKARAQFFRDTLNDLYSKRCDRSVRTMMKHLRSTDTFEYVRTEALFEECVADVLEAEYKGIARAEMAGYTNACGYDVLDVGSKVYLEMKEVSITQRGGATPILSAMVGNMKNKFCTTIVLAIDPYLEGTRKYQLYAIPPHAVPDDASDSLTIPHHKIDRSGKYEVYEQNAPLGGGTYGDYRIDSLADLLHMPELLQCVNVKKLVKVIRTLRGTGASETQKDELQHLEALFAHCTKNNTKKQPAKGVRKLSGDVKDQEYTIKKTGDRIFFDGSKIDFQAPSE